MAAITGSHAQEQASRSSKNGVLANQLDVQTRVLKNVVDNVTDRLASQMQSRASFCIVDQ